MSRTLKPCPFCGKPAELTENEYGAPMVACKWCLARTCSHSESLAIDKWNSRPGEDALRGALVGALERDAANWSAVRDLVRKIDAEARPGGVMADDDVLDVVVRILRRALHARSVEGALNQVEADIFAARGIVALHLHWDQVAKLRETQT
jgi:hypothetical protein